MRSSRPRVLSLEDRLAPALATWDGGGGDNNWTTAANWVGDVAPNPGDDLAFPAGVPDLISVNTFAAGTSFHTLQFTGLGYKIGGNDVSLTGGISATLPFATPAPDVHVLLPITLAADNVFSRSDTVGGANLIIGGRVNLNGHTLDLQPAGFPGLDNVTGLTFAGPITGTGSVTQSGDGTTVLIGNNTFVGTTTVNDGNFVVNGRTGALATNGAFLSGTGTVGTLASSFSAVFPGDLSSGAGVLTSGDFTQSGGGSINYRVNSGPTNVVNRLDVHGAVNLGGQLVFGVASNVVIRVGEVFTLIANDGTDPIVGTFTNAPEGANVGNVPGLTLRISYRGNDGNDVTVTAGYAPVSAVGAGAGSFPLVNLFNNAGQPYFSFHAYDQGFRGGVRVALADVNGDGVNDIVTAPGTGGGPVIRVFDGNTLAMVNQFLAYDANFFGGVFVSAADMNGDGKADIATGAGAGGGPHVKLFDGATGDVLSSFMAYNINFRGGVSVAAHELTTVDTGGGPPVDLPGTIVTGAGPGGGPHVRVFTALTGDVQFEFLAYDASFIGGINVATGNVESPSPNQFGNYNIITAPASNGPPVVRVFNGGTMSQQFLAFDVGFLGGVTLSTIRLGQNFSPILLTGAGPGGAPFVNQFQTLVDGNPLQLTRSGLVFDPAFTGGVFVG